MGPRSASTRTVDTLPILALANEGRLEAAVASYTAIVVVDAANTSPARFPAYAPSWTLSAVACPWPPPASGRRREISGGRTVSSSTRRFRAART